MIESHMIGRRDPQVALERDATPHGEAASAVLNMLCEAMHALSRGQAGDQIVCRHLGRALRADVAVTIALTPDRPNQVICTHPDTLHTAAVATTLLTHPLQAGEEEFRVEFLEDVGHVASMWIQPGDRNVGPAAEDAPGRLLAYVRARPFGVVDREVLDRARDALVAFWPHAARAVRVHKAHEWIRDAADDSHMTDRELQVLSLLAEGLLATSIASRLQLSPRTVHKHLGNIYRKLGVHDRLVAVSIARLQGLIDDYPSSPSSPGLGLQ